MRIDSEAFKRYSSLPNEKTTLPRLLVGLIVIIIFWVLATLAAITAGVYLYSVQQANAGLALPAELMKTFMSSPAGILTALVSFAGIWIGVWVAMRWVHGAPLGALFGNSRRISWPAFFKGLIAVFITSLFSEVLLYLMQPEVQRGTIALSSWLLFLLPIAALTFLQTSSEELLFRGYLPRNLANRFRSPLIWGLLPLLIFVSLHWSTSSTPSMNFAGLASIAAFALLLMILVYVTGNLGAAFGAHLGNNLTGFLLISHQESYNAFSLFTAMPLEGSGWTSLDALLITVIGFVSSALTLLLLMHPRSPLKVAVDRG